MPSNDLLGLEYVLLFGLPNNKLEIIDGYTRCCCPFVDRHAAETHFDYWMETLCRWKGVEHPTQVRKVKTNWQTDVAV